VLEIPHGDGARLNHRDANLVLLHGHCHDEIHVRFGNDGRSLS